MNEADWKQYSALVPVVRERYLAARNQELAVLLANEAEEASERFWEAEGRVRDIARILNNCFGHHSRSNMHFSLVLMIGHGLLTREDTTDFSDELKATLSKIFDERKRG